MNKVFNSKLFYFVLGAILFSGITVYASGAYLSSQVSFNPSNAEWNVNNVEDALNELYEKNKESEFLLKYNFGSNNSDFERIRTDLLASMLASSGYAYYKILEPTVTAGTCSDIYFTADWDRGVEYLEVDTEYSTSQPVQVIASGSRGCFYTVQILLYN